jgi:hypothetical protein
VTPTVVLEPFTSVVIIDVAGEVPNSVIELAAADGGEVLIGWDPCSNHCRRRSSWHHQPEADTRRRTDSFQPEA